MLFNETYRYSDRYEIIVEYYSPNYLLAITTSALIILLFLYAHYRNNTIKRRGEEDHQANINMDHVYINIDQRNYFSHHRATG